MDERLNRLEAAQRLTRKELNDIVAQLAEVWTRMERLEAKVDPIECDSWETYKMIKQSWNKED